MTTIILSIAIIAMAAVHAYAVYVLKNFLSSTKTSRTKKPKEKEVKPETPMTDDTTTDTPPVEKEVLIIGEEQKQHVDKKAEEEKERIIKALKKSKGQIANAASALNIPYSTFYKKAKAYKLESYMSHSRGTRLEKLERINKYCTLRKQSFDMIQAAQEVGVKLDTALKYELIYKNQYASN
jgi:hypothetical protein